MTVTQGEVTELLREMKQDRDTFERLTCLVYDDIRQMARIQRREFRGTPTLETTAVAHEAFAKLFQGNPHIVDRQHLMCLMSRVIRQVVVDHARRQMRAKRGCDPVRSDSDIESLPAETRDAARVIDLENALTRLEEVEPELVDLICAHYFAGHSARKLAEVSGVTRRTINRHLERAKIWLRFELGDA
jgi:RNA polymerase sigma factor (TIGR02999 family)